MAHEKPEPTASRGKDPLLPAQLIPLATTAEQLGFMRVPEPECLGRPDSRCDDEHHAHVHAHGRHAHMQGHDGHEHPPEEPVHHEEEGHEHMRVFPVFELDAQGQIVESVDEEGRLSENVQRALAEAGEADPEGEKESETSERGHEHPRGKSSTPRKPRKKP